MNRGIYSVATGMLASQQQMDVVSNNLANVNTAGYKQDRLLFNDILERSVASSNGSKLGTLGAGGTVKEEITDFAQGALKETGNTTDLALQGQGMFAVQDPNGKVAYTRDGAFIKRSDGTLVNTRNEALLDSSEKPIVVQPGGFHVSASGEITNGTSGTPYARIGIYKGTFTKRDDGHYLSSDAVSDSTTQVQQGVTETSNVSAITSMVDMINLGRTYEMSQKSIQSEDEMSEKLNSLLS